MCSVVNSIDQFYLGSQKDWLCGPCTSSLVYIAASNFARSLANNHSAFGILTDSRVFRFVYLDPSRKHFTSGYMNGSETGEDHPMDRQNLRNSIKASHYVHKAEQLESPQLSEVSGRRHHNFGSQPMMILPMTGKMLVMILRKMERLNGNFKAIY